MRPLLLKAHVKEYGTWIIKQWQAACVVVVILRHRYHHSEGDLSQSSRGGKNPDNNKILGPAHTQKNWLLFPLTCFVAIQEKNAPVSQYTLPSRSPPG